MDFVVLVVNVATKGVPDQAWTSSLQPECSVALLVAIGGSLHLLRYQNQKILVNCFCSSRLARVNGFTSGLQDCMHKSTAASASISLRPTLPTAQPRQGQATGAPAFRIPISPREHKSSGSAALQGPIESLQQLCAVGCLARPQRAAARSHTRPPPPSTSHQHGAGRQRQVEGPKAPEVNIFKGERQRCRQF